MRIKPITIVCPCTRALLTLLGCCALAAPAAAFPRTHDAVTVRARDAFALHGIHKNLIRVFAFKDGAAVPIPFQIDEREEKRGSTGKWQSRYALTRGPKANPDADPAFDNLDELCFMAKDLGAPIGAASPPRGARDTLEIIATDPVSGATAYAYAAHFAQPPPLAPDDYVRFDLATDTTYATHYVIGNTPGKVLFDHLEILPPAGGQPGVDLMDRIKTRNYIKLRGFLFGLDFSLNEEDFTSTVLAWNDGPIRILKRTQIGFKFIGGITIKTDIDENIYYFGHYIIPKRIKAPFDIASVASEGTLRISPEFTAAVRGSTYYCQACGTGVAIDGQMSPAEEAIIGKPHRWQIVTGPAGTLIERTTVDSSLDMPRTQYYRDDATLADPPERTPGATPAVGSMASIMGIKKGRYWFDSYVMFPGTPFKKGDESRYFDIRDRPLAVRLKPLAQGQPLAETPAAVIPNPASPTAAAAPANVPATGLTP